MPKLKTKSSLKGRFRFSKNGKLLRTHKGKRHNMRKRSARSKRNNKGISTACPAFKKKVLACIGGLRVEALRRS